MFELPCLLVQKFCECFDIVDWGIEILERRLGDLEGCGESCQSALYRGGLSLKFKCLVAFCSLRNTVILNLCEMEESLGTRISQKVGKLILRHYDADLLHAFRLSHLRGYSPKTVEDISARSWVSSLSKRDSKVLLKTTLT